MMFYDSDPPEPTDYEIAEYYKARNLELEETNATLLEACEALLSYAEDEFRSLFDTKHRPVIIARLEVGYIDCECLWAKIIKARRAIALARPKEAQDDVQ